MPGVVYVNIQLEWSHVGMVCSRQCEVGAGEVAGEGVLGSNDLDSDLSSV